MKFADMMFKSLELVQGMEKDLRQRRRNAFLGLLITVAGIAQQIFVATSQENYFKKIGEIKDLLVQFPESLGFYLILGGFIVFATLRWTNLLMQEAEEPFRYTFHIDDFKPIEGTPGDRFKLENMDRMKLLAHDLAERLNQRITRLSILNPSSDTAKEEKKEEKNLSLSSHIHIEGDYVVRQKDDEQWVIQVMTRVRIGSSDRPMTLAHPVKYELPEKTADDGKHELSADEYNQIVELVYSRAVTEVYRQIEKDIQGKMPLFPTAYQRAVALSCEARDFSRSNTIDAYDRAITLYRQALRYFSVADIKPLTSFFSRLPLMWRHEARFIHKKAAVITGYSECLIYRRKLSAQSGRYRNPVFEIPRLLNEVIVYLASLQRRITGIRNSGRPGATRAFLTFPKDDWRREALWRPLEHHFEKQRQVYFDTLVANALAFNELSAKETAANLLNDARAVDPERCERDPLFLLTKGEIEPELDTSVQLLQMAADIAPSFQFAKFRLAYCNEMKFRRAGELLSEKAESVIKTYDEIIQNINPGNIAALFAQGYLYWLLAKCETRGKYNQDNDCGLRNPDCPRLQIKCPRSEMGQKAEKKFKQGLALKSIVQETYVGELNYGLARIAAEKCHFNDCYDYFTQAVSADPGIAAHALTYNNKHEEYTNYEYISHEMMNRFQCYHDNVLTCLRELRNNTDIDLKDDDAKKCSKHTLDVVEGFVRNDFGNACFNYYRRIGLPSYLDKAIKSYEAAKISDETNAVVHFNLAAALSWKREAPPELVAEYFSRAKVLAPRWPEINVAVVRAGLNAIQTLERDIINIEDEIKAILDRQRNYGSSPTAEDGREDSTYNIVRGQSDIPSVSQIKPIDSILRSLALQFDELMIRKQSKLTAAGIKRCQILNELCSTITASKFGYLFNNPVLQITKEGGGIDVIAQTIIKPDRIDENDIYALRLWAEVLCSGVLSKDISVLKKGLQLCLLLEEYYPEDFDRSLFQSGAIMLIQRELNAKTGSIMNGTSEKAGVRTYLRQAVKLRRQGRKAVLDAIKRDPEFYSILEWLSDINLGFKPRIQIQFLECIHITSPARSILLGRWYMSIDNFEKAIANFRTAVQFANQEALYWNELGNAYFTSGMYMRSLNIYRKAIKLDDKVPDFHANMGLARKKLGKWDKACVAYDNAIKLENNKNKKGEYLNDLRLTFNDWGNHLYERGRYSEAREKYQKALELDRNYDVIHSNLALAWEQEVPEQEAIDNAISALTEATKLAHEKDDYKQRLNRLWVLSRHHCGIRKFHLFFTPDAQKFIPVVNPIVLEVASNLIPFVSHEDALLPEFQGYINEVRDSILNDFGINIPGIRVRGNEALPADTYVISLMEVPLVSGNVRLDRQLVLASSEELKKVMVNAEDAIDPLTGAAASWIKQTDFERIKGTDFIVIDLLGCLFRHLQAVICRNLAEFNGVQETLGLMEMICRDKIELVHGSRHGLVGLTMVLKTLLSEEVPITQLTEIVNEFLNLSETGLCLADIMEKLRRLPKVKETLPGNKAGMQHFGLTQEFENTLRQSIHGVDEVPILAMNPETKQDALTAIRNEAADFPAAAIVVKDPLIRPYLRTLVELEFPRLHVLAIDELVQPLSVDTMREISL